MEAIEVKRTLNLVPELLDVPYSRIWAVYDKEADVLYLNFKKPSHAEDSELTDDNLIIRYEKGSVVGITVLNASRRRAGYGRGVRRGGSGFVPSAIRSNPSTVAGLQIHSRTLSKMAKEVS